MLITLSSNNYKGCYCHGNMVVPFSCEFDSTSGEVALTKLYLIKVFSERFEDTKRANNMYREYNGQWRQLEAGKICTENTMVNEGN